MAVILMTYKDNALKGTDNGWGLVDENGRPKLAYNEMNVTWATYLAGAPATQKTPVAAADHVLRQAQDSTALKTLRQEEQKAQAELQAALRAQEALQGSLTAGQGAAGQGAVAAHPPVVTTRGDQFFADNKPVSLRVELLPPKFWVNINNANDMRAALNPQANIIVSRRPLSQQALDAAFSIKGPASVFVGFNQKDIDSGYYMCYIHHFSSHPAIAGWTLLPDGTTDAAFLEKHTGYVNKFYTLNPQLRHLPIVAMYQGMPSEDFLKATPSVDVWGLNFSATDEPAMRPERLANKPVFFVGAVADANKVFAAGERYDQAKLKVTGEQVKAKALELEKAHLQEELQKARQNLKRSVKKDSLLCRLLRSLNCLH